MRELDLLLTRYLHSRYEDLSPDERSAFARLLEQNDQDIMAWILGHGTPEDDAQRKIIQQLSVLNI